MDRDVLLAEMGDAATPNEIATAISDARAWLARQPDDTAVRVSMERLISEERLTIG